RHRRQLEIEAGCLGGVAGETRIELSAEQKRDLGGQSVDQHQRYQHDDPRRLARAATHRIARVRALQIGQPEPGRRGDYRVLKSERHSRTFALSSGDALVDALFRGPTSELADARTGPSANPRVRRRHTLAPRRAPLGFKDESYPGVVPDAVRR